MKKNEFATFLVYILMFAIALLVGFLVIRNTVTNWKISNSVLVIIVSAVVGLIFNAFLIEGLHVLGAKAGKMEITFFCVLGLGWKKQANGKMKFAFSSFDGLTGETRYSPKDIKKSSLSASIAFPILAYLLEVIGLAIAMAFVTRDYTMNNNTANKWVYIAAVAVLTVGAMLFLYDYFPAHLDSLTDGYRMTILTKAINREAYNRLLLAERKAELNLPADPAFIYDEVTDFTYQINNLAVYQTLEKEDYRGAINIVQKTFDTELHVSSSVKNQAMAQKLSLVLLTTKREDGAKYYESITDDERKYLASLSDSVTLRCFILISGVIEGDINETNYAFSKVERIIKKTPKSIAATEKKLLDLSYTRVHLLHPDWQLDYQKEEEAKPVDDKPTK